MAKYTGVMYIPFDIEYASKADKVEEIVNAVLDTFGQHDFSHLSFTWDNPDYVATEIEEK
jgi:hypothetical protein